MNTWPRAVDHDVGGLQIAMQHALVVRGGQTRAELARDLQRLIGGQPADAAQQRAEIFAIDVFHGKKRLAVDFADVVDAADIGMRDLARDAHFVVEARQQHPGLWAMASGRNFSATG